MWVFLFFFICLLSGQLCFIQLEITLDKMQELCFCTQISEVVMRVADNQNQIGKDLYEACLGHDTLPGVGKKTFVYKRNKTKQSNKKRFQGMLRYRRTSFFFLLDTIILEISLGWHTHNIHSRALF